MGDHAVAVAEQRAFLSKLAGRPVELIEFGPQSHHTAICRLDGHPSVGLNTLVTFGASPAARSMWRGLPLHYELVLTLESNSGLALEITERLQTAVQEEHRRAREKDRRPVIEANGVWAPGYAPHLAFFATSTAPDLVTRRKFGARYVSFLEAVPIDDPELRTYDRSPADFMASLSPDTVVRYPRTAG